MKPSPYVPGTSLLAVVTLVGLTVAACTERQPTSPDHDGITAARAASGSSDPTVDAVNPTSATQDTTLDVTVSGSGYDKGFTVDLALAGVTSPNVRTNSTTFVNPKKLIANITIAVDADTGKYDVVVTALDGRKGIGIELFTVKETGQPWFRGDPGAIFEYPVDDAAYKIQSDHRTQFLSTDGQSYVYVNGECGINAKFFSPDDGDGSGDAVMADASPLGSDKRICGSPRYFTITYDNPADGLPPPANPVEINGTFQNMMQLWQMPIGVEVEGQAGFNPPFCNILRFKPEPKREGDWYFYPGSDKVLVYRSDERIWHIRTKPYPNDRAFCGRDGRFYHLPFALTVRIQ